MFSFFSQADKSSYVLNIQLSLVMRGMFYSVIYVSKETVLKYFY